MKNEEESFHNRLWHLMEEQGWTTNGFADALDIRRATLYGWRASGKFPPADIAARMAELLHVSLEYLVTGKRTSIETKLSEIALLAEEIRNKAMGENKTT